jgi:hypothetical protein
MLFYFSKWVFELGQKKFDLKIDVGVFCDKFGCLSFLGLSGHSKAKFTIKSSVQSIYC